MAYWIYSSEALPNPEMMGKRGYTPDSEYIRWNGVTLPLIPKKKWLELPDSFTTTRKSDWRSRPEEVEIHVRKFKPVIQGRFAERGVIFLDHQPTDYEKTELEGVSQQLNLAWRRTCIQWYEDQVREKEVTGHGRTVPTPYEDECYDMLGMEKPYSVKAMQAQRNPGQEAALQIAEAISRGRVADATAIGKALADALRPPPPPEPARK